jgi:hypothetical protein
MMSAAEGRLYEQRTGAGRSPNQHTISVQVPQTAMRAARLIVWLINKFRGNFAMKTITKLMLASSALVGGIANAQINVLPTAVGGSDLVLFVTDTATGAAFVQDLGVNVDSLGVTVASVTADYNANPQNSYSLFGNFTSPGPMGSGGTISVGAGLISGGIDSSLASWESMNGCTASTCSYSIIGAAAGDGSQGPGQGRFVATMSATQGMGVFGGEPSSSNVVAAASSTTAFFQSVNGTGAPATYDYTSGAGKNAAANFQVGGNNANTLGSTVYFYEAATFGTNNDANIYASTDAIVVGLNGAISGLSSGTSAVPLPAAIWLLGSGVLGLFGIGRRRSAATAA